VRRATVLALVTVALTGCSASDATTSARVAAARSSADAASSASATPSSPESSGHPGATGLPGGGTQVASSGNQGSSGASNLSGPHSTANGITVTLGYGCVVPGGQQAIAIDTHGQASVSFNTRYRDGKLGQDYGGVMIGMTDAAGSFRDAWTIAQNAAVGTATVQVGMSQGGRTTAAYPISFEVATRC